MRREYQGGAEVWKSSGYQITEKHLEKVVIERCENSDKLSKRERRKRLAARCKIWMRPLGGGGGGGGMDQVWPGHRKTTGIADKWIS